MQWNSSDYASKVRYRAYGHMPDLCLPTCPTRPNACSVHLPTHAEVPYLYR
jgi:hypothetical protein